MSVVLVCGSRSWDEPTLIGKRLARLPRGTKIRHGGARGVDRYAGIYARALGFEEQVFKADWFGRGKRAGILRNLEMLDAPIRPRYVIAFWDGKSTGTKHTIDAAHERSIPVELHVRSAQ